MKKLSIVLLASLISACSSSEQLITPSVSIQANDSHFSQESALISQLRTAELETISLDHLPYQMAALDKNNRLEITPDSPIISMPQGKSYVAALFMPEQVNGFTVILESDAKSTVFVPSVLFLNENLEEVTHLDEATFNRKGYFSTEQTFSGEQAKAIRYLLIYTDNQNLGKETEIVNPAREYELAKGNAVSDSQHPRLYSKHSPIGRVDVKFENIFYTAKAIQQKITQTTEAPQASLIPAEINKSDILSDTENFYLQQISKAVGEGNLSRAMRLVEEAERAGSYKARAHYQQQLNQ